MPIRDVTAMNRSLDNDYGPTAGPQAASSHLLALYDGDPMMPADDGGGVELGPDGGYTRAEVPASAWLPSADGLKSVRVVLPDTTGEWPDEATHWALLDGDDPTVVWDCGPLSEPLEVTGAARGPRVTITVYYDDALSERDDQG